MTTHVEYVAQWRHKNWAKGKWEELGGPGQLSEVRKLVAFHNAAPSSLEGRTKQRIVKRTIHEEVIEESMNDDIEPQEEKENYVPPTGWVQIPVMRGLYEIEPLLDLCDKFGGKIIGGYPRFCCSPAERVVKAGDVDIFPTGATEEESKAVYDKWSVALAALGLEVQHENNVSLTYKKTDKSPFNRCPTIQLIKPILEGAIVTRGTTEEILDSFDFTIVRVALNADRKTATAWASFAEDEARHKLRLLNIHCPISSLLRVMKYGRKGYYMRPVEALKLFADWSERSPEYRNRMADLFLTGTMGKLSKQEIDELEALLRVD